MRYQVPQFIEVEDKIFGPFTFKQFAYMAGGAGLAFIAYRFLPIYASVFIIVPALALGAALAFYRMNGRPFIDMMESAFNYLLSSKLYVWKKEDRKPEDAVKKEVEDITNAAKGVYVPKLSESKLKDLTWSLDINETVYSRESRKLQQGGSIQQKQRPF
jgi:hypothetical protein